MKKNYQMPHTASVMLMANPICIVSPTPQDDGKKGGNFGF